VARRLSAAPFVVLQLSALTLVVAFPDIVLWLPQTYLNLSTG
jgi:TRAP-type C4-dicarboxylate transport system permease large subunit